MREDQQAPQADATEKVRLLPGNDHRGASNFPSISGSDASPDRLARPGSLASCVDDLLSLGGLGVGRV